MGIFIIGELKFMNKRNDIGVMQGRLLPKYQGRYQAHPLGFWQEEFTIAKNYRLDLIEFILDHTDYKKNPLMSDEGLEQIKNVSQVSGVSVKSVCADYFMVAPFFNRSVDQIEHSQQVLNDLIVNCAKISIKNIVLPCVDSSSLLNTTNKTDELIDNLLLSIEMAEKHRVNISLETDLNPELFGELIHKFNSPVIKVNYDIGNSAALGYNPREEIAVYGKFISDVHIKDRMFNGGSVLLGTGASDFEEFFCALAAVNYQGPFIMQAYRDEEGEEIFGKQLDWIRPLINNFIEMRTEK